MGNLTERERQEFALVEAAARAYPLADTPTDFSAVVMSRVRAASPVPPFRITLQEIILSLFIAGIAILASAAWFSLPPQTQIYIQMRIILSWQPLLFTRLGWAILVGGLEMMALFFVAIVWLLRPHYHRLKIMPTTPSRVSNTLHISQL
jgi:hypothetical protein